MTHRKASASVLLTFVLAGLSLNTSAAPFALVPQDSRIEFVVKEMGVPVSGMFTRFEADVDIDAVNPEKSLARLRIDVGSLTTGNEEADAIAVDPNWLDRVHAPVAQFRSASIRSLDGNRYVARGTLSIRNKERDVDLQFTRADPAPGKTVIEGNLVIKRSEFGIGGGEWNEGGVVAEDIPVKVRLSLAPASNKVPLAAVR